MVETGSRTLSILGPDFEKIQTIKLGKKPIDIQLSPDSRHAYVTDEEDNRVLIFEITGLS